MSACLPVVSLVIAKITHVKVHWKHNYKLTSQRAENEMTPFTLAISAIMLPWQGRLARRAGIVPATGAVAAVP